MHRRIVSLTLLTVVSLAPAAHADPPCWLRADVVAEVTRRVEHHLGLDAPVTRAMAERARRVGWVPTVSLRVMRGMGTGSSLVTQSATGRWSTDDSLVFDLRASFHFDHLVFDRHEIDLLRVESQREERRLAVGRSVIDLLAALESARRGPADPAREVDVLRTRARLEQLLGAPLDALPWRGPARVDVQGVGTVPGAPNDAPGGHSS